MKILYLPGEYSGANTKRTQAWIRALNQYFEADDVVVVSDINNKGYRLIQDFKTICERIRNELENINDDILLFTHSAGGTIARKIAAEYTEKIKIVVTMAAAHRSSGVIRPFQRFLLSGGDDYSYVRLLFNSMQDWFVYPFNWWHSIPKSITQQHWTCGGGNDARILECQTSTRESLEEGRHITYPSASHSSFCLDPGIRAKVIANLKKLISEHEGTQQ